MKYLLKSSLYLPAYIICFLLLDQFAKSRTADVSSSTLDDALMNNVARAFHSG